MTQKTVPPGLVESICEGRCVAFVGAGLLQPCLPGWQKLLERLAEALGGRQGAEFRRWLGRKTLSRRDFEGIGEGLRSALGDRFGETLKAALAADLESGTRQRIAWLQGIPFHYVLTTNFDHHLGESKPVDQEAFAGLVAARTRTWSDGDFWDGVPGQSLWSDRLLALHGHLQAAETLVFDTRSYRALLHGMPAYRAMMRTLFTTRNILFLGFSFTDAYVDDLRSEILSMVGLEGAARELMDYAILEDLAPPARAHLREKENLEVLPVDTRGRFDFSDFDGWLQAIHGATNPTESLRARLRGARILWFDPNPRHNTFAFEALAHGLTLDVAQSVEEAARRVGAAEGVGAPYGLVISHWGYRADGPPNAVQLLDRLPLPRPPVLVFASGMHRPENRAAALRHGALGYADTWEELFTAMDAVLLDARS